MLLASDLLSYALGRKGWLRFLSTYLFFISQVILAEILLGIFSLLYSFALFIFNSIVACIVIYLVQKKWGRKTLTKYFIELKHLPKQVQATLLEDKFFFVLTCIGGVILFWIIFLGVIFPALDYDGNSYHLTFVANVVQNHNFFDTSTSLPWLSGYPKGGEFIQMWSAIITHRDMFTDLAQVPFLFLGIYALYSIALAIGADKKHARFAALLFLFLPIVLNQLKTTYVDVMLCSLFFAGLAVVIREKLSKLDLVLLGTIFSLLIATKSTGLLVVLVLCLPLLWNLYLNYGKKVKKYIPSLLLIALPTTFGLYWYIKNWILYGTPLYPFGYKFGGLTLFQGKTFQQFSTDALTQTILPHSSLERIWYVWTEQKDWFGCLYNYDGNYTGLGPIWFIILMPALVTALYIAIRKRNLLFLSITSLFFLLFLIYPNNFYTRYTMFISGLGIVSLAYVLTYISKFGARLVKGLTIALALFVVGTNFVLCNYTPGTVADQFNSFTHRQVRGPVYSVVPGNAFVFIENRLKSGDIVAYTSRPFFIYPLWKPDFSNKVIFIKSNNREDWLKKLHDQRVDYVFATTGSKEQRWADGRLKSIYKDNMYEIYQTN